MNWFLLLIVGSVAGNLSDIFGDTDKNETSRFLRQVKKSRKHRGLFYDSEKDNKYYLFTRHNPTKGHRLIPNVYSTLLESNYNMYHRTAVLIHGWRSDLTSPFFTELIPAFIAAADINVIYVDWRAGSSNMIYEHAVYNAFDSGFSVSRFIKWLVKESWTDLSLFHIVGHSLGAHQAGLVGRALDGNVSYITSLDPASTFWDVLKIIKCTAKDAKYTEAIHTDGDWYGTMSRMAQVDFYPNGGKCMPGWSDATSHTRAINYFAESLWRSNFTGVKCPSMGHLDIGECYGSTLRMGGINAKPGHTGIYYLQTNEYSPYSLDPDSTSYAQKNRIPN